MENSLLVCHVAILDFVRRIPYGNGGICILAFPSSQCAQTTMSEIITFTDIAQDRGISGQYLSVIIFSFTTDSYDTRLDLIKGPIGYGLMKGTGWT